MLAISRSNQMCSHINKKYAHFQNYFQITTLSKRITQLVEDPDESSQLLSLYKIDVNVKSEKLMILKEQNQKQIILQANEIPYNSIVQTFETNKYLLLPRITSKSLFYELCPISSFDMQSKLVAFPFHIWLVFFFLSRPWFSYDQI